jgi:hypothetical protein
MLIGGSRHRLLELLKRNLIRAFASLLSVLSDEDADGLLIGGVATGYHIISCWNNVSIQDAVVKYLLWVTKNIRKLGLVRVLLFMSFRQTMSHFAFSHAEHREKCVPPSPLHSCRNLTFPCLQYNSDPYILRYSIMASLPPSRTPTRHHNNRNPPPPIA